MSNEPTPLPTPRDANERVVLALLGVATFAGANLGAELTNDTRALERLLGGPLFTRLTEFAAFCENEGAQLSGEILAKLGEG